MDVGTTTTIVSGVVFSIASVCATVIGFFLKEALKRTNESIKDLTEKTGEIEKVGMTNSIHIAALIEQTRQTVKLSAKTTEHVSNMDRDLAILKFEILKKLGVSLEDRKRSPEDG